VLLASATPALAGRAATGDLAFYPCDRCHPVSVDSKGHLSHPLPHGMKKHQIELEVHDILGKDERACLACHDDPSRNPGMLVLPDGSLVDIKKNPSAVCQRCHFDMYRRWKVGAHGRGEAKCSAAGCHDPHTPSWIYIRALPPFQGTGLEVDAVGSDREPFKPFAAPPLPAEVTTPGWLTAVALLGFAGCASIVGFLVVGGRKR
jgi:hypothetical protein